MAETKELKETKLEKEVQAAPALDPNVATLLELMIAEKKEKLEISKREEESRLAKTIMDKDLQNTYAKRVQMFASEEKVDCSIPATYQPHFGDHLSLSLNGVTALCPVDGSVFKLNKSHAHELKIRLARINHRLKGKSLIKEDADAKHLVEFDTRKGD